MDEVDALGETAEAQAERTAEVFEQAGERISQALERAARSGELSFNRMAESILQDLARTAIQDLVLDPLTSALSSIGGGAAGAGRSHITVNMNAPSAPTSGGFSRTAGQTAASLARAVARGQRYG